MRKGQVLGVSLLSGIALGAVGARAVSQRGWASRRGSIRCSSEDPFPFPARGDFGVFQILGVAGEPSELVWGRVLGVEESGKVRVELTGEKTGAGMDPLKTVEHGFSAGEVLSLLPGCFLAVMKAPPGGWRLLCGPSLKGVEKVPDPQEDPPLEGDTVWVSLVPPGKGHDFSSAISLATRVVGIPGGLFLNLEVTGGPTLPDGSPGTSVEDLKPGTQFGAGRDCLWRIEAQADGLPLPVPGQPPPPDVPTPWEGA